MKRKLILMVATVVASVASAAACPPLLPKDVCRMQKQVYLETDFKQTDSVRAAMVGLKDLLIRHDGAAAVVREHILGLVDHVIEKAHQERAPWPILATATG